MDMEHDKFLELVDTLLEPQVKEHIKKKRLAAKKDMDMGALETSIKLAPKTQRRPCPDCDKIVENRVVEFYVRGMGTKNQHWKKHCLSCGDKTVISHPLTRKK